MPSGEARPIWRATLERISDEVEDIHFPRGEQLEQDLEWCEVRTVDGACRKIRFHDYHAVYEIPGLYERLFYERLQCNSPAKVVGLLEDVMREDGSRFETLRVLDVGAGNGMVGEELAARDVRKLVGIDIIPEARQATERDRPELYDDYQVADLTDLPEHVEERLRKHQLNALTTVAALGFGDIPTKAFLKALDLIDTPGWTAFNIKENFFHDRDTTGFSALIRSLSRSGVIQIQAYWRYRHRLSTAGEPLYYVAVVARKKKEVPDELMQA